MIFKDDLYGTFEVNDPIIIDLIRTYPLRRLKGIDTAGYSQAFYPNGRTRYDHSIGVFLLLRKYDASIEEQIAGLIHDVSHYAFSHAVDYILKDGNIEKQDLQDRVFEHYVRNSDVVKILKRYACDVDYVLEEKNFPLKENEIPDICADRIDYCLKDSIRLGHRTLDEIKDLLSHLYTHEQRDWYFDTVEYALKFAELFNEMNSKEYSGIKSASMFKGIKDVMKYSLERNYISTDDFEKDDTHVLGKVIKYVHTDPQLEKYWNRMNNKVVFENNPKNFEEEVWCKSRIVDPYFMEKNQLIRLSDRHTEWKSVVEQELKPKQYFIRVVE